MKIAIFLAVFLLVLCVVASVICFSYRDTSLGISYIVVGIFPLALLAFCLCTIDSKRGSGLPTEQDLQDEVMYEVVGECIPGKPVLLKNFANGEVLLYKITCVPLLVFRGKDAKNFSKLKIP